MPWTAELQAHFDAATALTPEQAEITAECPVCHFGQGIAKGVIHTHTRDIKACVPCIWTLRTLPPAERRWAVRDGYDTMEWQPKRLPQFRRWLLETGRFVEHQLQKAS